VRDTKINGTDDIMKVVLKRHYTACEVVHQDYFVFTAVSLVRPFFEFLEYFHFFQSQSLQFVLEKYS